MKLARHLLNAVAFCFLASLSLSAAVPTQISYQGKLAVDGTGHSGTAYFKFAFVDADGATTYWSHDGTSSAGIEPGSSISLETSSGLFSVNLGDTNLAGMSQVIAPSVFENASVYMKVWVSTNSAGPFEALTPSTRVTASAYALNAARAESVADGAVTAASIADGSVTSGKLSSNISITTTGAISAGSISGNGSALTQLNSSNLVGLITATNGLVGINTLNPTGDLHIAAAGIFDVASARVVGSVIDGTGTATRLYEPASILVAGQYAYVPASGDHALNIFDLNNPTSPELVLTITNGMTYNGKTFNALQTPSGGCISGNYLYLASYDSNALNIIDISNPISPVLVSEFTETNGFTFGKEAFHLSVAGNYVYVTALQDNSLSIIDVSNKAAPTLVSTIVDGSNGFDNLGMATGVAISGDYAYVCGSADNTLNIINVSNAASPQLVTTISNTATVNGHTYTNFVFPVNMAFVGDYLYIPSYSGKSLTIINVTNPAAPVFVKQIVNGSTNNGLVCSFSAPIGIHVSGNYAYVGDFGANSVIIFDVSNPADPLLVKTVSFGGPGYLLINPAIQVVGNYAYAVDGHDSMEVISLAKEATVVVEGKIGIGTSSPTEAVDVVGNIAATGTITGSSVTANSLNVADGTLYVDTTNKRVGIGNTNPVEKLHVEGNVQASSFIGNGGSLQNLDASRIASGTLDDNRLSQNIPRQNADAVFSIVTASELRGNGWNITNLNAGNIIGGTLDDARLSGNVARLDVSPTFTGSVTATEFSGASATLSGSVSAGSFTGNGTALTGLNAANLTSGQIPDARLSANVALLNGNPTFTGSVTAPTFSGSNAVFSGSVTAARFSGNGASLTNLNATNITSGTLSETLLPSNVAKLNSSPTFTGTVSAASFSGSGSLLTGVDLSTGNELNSDVTLSGNVLSITDAGGTKNADLSTLATNGFNTSMTLSGSTLNVTDAGGTKSADLSSLTTAAYNTGVSFSGGVLTVTDAGATRTANISALSASDGSPSSVVSADTAGNVAIDTTTLYVSASNNRVGMGTNNPQNKLHIHAAGGSGEGILLSSSSSNDGADISWDSGATTRWSIDQQGSAATLRFSTSSNGVFSARVNFAENGAVGIGRAPVSNLLEVEGNASKSTSGSWLANSDGRIKTNVETVTNALDALSRVRLVSFRYTDEYRAGHSGVDDRDYHNVIAQEFQQVFPDYVKSSGEKLSNGEEILQVDTYPLTIYSAAAIQELKIEKDTEIQLLRNENNALKSETASLKAETAALQRRLEALEKLMISPVGDAEGAEAGQ